jgi:organizing structure protein 2
MNETKRSRSFYEQDEDISFSPILDTSEVPQDQPTELIKPKVEQSSTEKIVTKYVDGHKIKTSSFLETHVNSVRNQLIDQWNYASAELSNLQSAACNEWNNVTESVTSVYDPRDEFLPSFIYALTGTLVGSILVNQRSLPVRFITPVTFGLAGFKLFLPYTFSNTVNAVKNYEAEEYPDLLQFQRSLKQYAIETEQSIEQLSEDAKLSLIQGVHDIRESITK